VQSYGASSYGDGMAEVYDAWYQDLGDTDACVATLIRLAGAGPVLELGVGTGRLALPLAQAGLEVHGVDASAAMLERLAAKPGAQRVHAVLGDMAGPLPRGPFSLVFVAYNTFFNLTTQEAQRRCLASVAGVLAPGGSFVLDAFVPDHPATPGQAVEVRSIEADRVVLMVSRHDPARQEARTQFVEITSSGVRLRPSFIRYAPPAELDQLAADAGLVLERRWAAWDGTPFDDDSSRHVSVYRMAGAAHQAAPGRD